MHDQKEKNTPSILMDSKQIDILIPICCREGWETCPHVSKKQKKVKKNVGL